MLLINFIPYIDSVLSIKVWLKQVFSFGFDL